MTRHLKDKGGFYPTDTKTKRGLTTRKKDMSLFQISNLNGTFPPDNFTAPNGMTFGELKEYEDIFNIAQGYAVWFCLLAVGVFIFGSLSVMCYSSTAEHQIYTIRQQFFQSVMRQGISWFDMHDSGELSSRLTQDIHLISDGIGDKFATMIQWFTTFVAAYIIAFLSGWKLALATVGFCPVIIITGGSLVRFMRNLAKEESDAYSKAGSVAEEALGNIKTVMAFNGQSKECARYNSHLSHAKSNSAKKGVLVGLSGSVLWLLLYGAFAVAFWYGIKLIQDQESGFDPGSTLTVFLGVMIGSMSLGNAFPTLEILANARGAAQKVYEVIELISEIDPVSTEGKTLENYEGNIELRDVFFDYPARPDTPVLQGMSLKVGVGQTVALVGSSGCGKSTVIQLLQRFYDAELGQVLLDGHEVKTLNVNWLRRQVGVVSQEPILFATTIAENIRYGRLEVTMEEIKTAAREANAHEFISEFPEGYETLVGERGAQMSGGQKQRIAIARALVRNPKILLLDEATSALDNESEAVVQKALEKAQEGRTTIVIAHRLSTIRNADIIYGIDDGRVMEHGTHDELMQEEGLYCHLVNQQVFTHMLSRHRSLLLNQYMLQFFRNSKKKAGYTFLFMIKQLLLCHVQTGKEEDEEEDVPEVSVGKVLRMNSPEWYLILGACMCSTLVGAIQPSFGLVLAEFLTVSSSRVVSFCQISICYSTAGARLTARFRTLAFKSIMWQDIPFFDDPKNRVGTLTTRLARDSGLVQGAAGNKLGAVLESLATVTAALVIAFINSWRLTLVVLAFMPLMVLSGVVHGKMLTGFSKGDKTVTEESGKLTSEAINNIRTVASLTREQSFIDKYNNFLNALYTNGKKRSVLQGVMYGLSQSIMFFAYAATFTYGGYLVQYENLPFESVFKVFAAIVFGGMSVGRQSSYAPDYNKGKLAASRLFQLIEMKATIDTASEEGSVMTEFRGSILLDGVHFHYPTRPEVEVLRGLSMIIQPGETVAIVGTSGCGKSTTVQLLERFYDPEGGCILADGNDIKSLNLKWFRNQIGIVSQEPCLFDCSIAENIAYGDNSRIVPMDEIISAARKANIHQFINSLPDGYDTNVGDKGTQLSGGQKQRVAIARALIRNPKVLLLDEATSALDAESERVVQEALDKARAGRTCLVIAHRLSTIQNSDRIAILHKVRCTSPVRIDGHALQIFLLQYKDTFTSATTKQQAMTTDISQLSLDRAVPSGDMDPNGDSHGKHIVNQHDETPPWGILSHGHENIEQNNNATANRVLCPDVDFEKDKSTKLGEEIDTNDEMKIGVFGLFRYATCTDKVLMCIGTLCAAIAGCLAPLNLLVYGKVANALILNQMFKMFVSNLNGTFPPDNFTVPNGMTFGELKEYEGIFDITRGYAVWFCLFAVCVFIFGFVSVMCYSATAEHQIYTIRQQFFQSIMRQGISWFDMHDSGELSSVFNQDIHLISDGIGDKFATMLQWFTTFVAAYIIAFLSGWKLALATVGFYPVIMVTGGSLVRVMGNLAKEEYKSYSRAGSVAEEAIGNIKTVIAFNGQSKECARYNSRLSHAKSNYVRKGVLVGLSDSVLWLLIFGVLAVTFWYGVKLVQDQENGFDPGNTLTIFFVVISGSLSLGNAFPTLEILTNARGAAQRVYEVIELTSEIDPVSTEGKTLENFEGNIEFTDVFFDYPARPDTPVLQGLSLKVSVGQTVALVGSSGCGKSTVIQLLQRFYDADFGEVLLDGHAISTLKVNWLRRQMGIVSQEPILFATTIAENIRYGRLEVTMEEIKTTAREANAHEFISEFPEGYETLVGERGAQMSGGQKQRIAIARALVRNPKILLLDEATSALDNESEAVVQKALEKAQEGRTTIVIAHRLSTIRNADIIYGIDKGQVMEQGTHDELMQEDGLYCHLVNQQVLKYKYLLSLFHDGSRTLLSLIKLLLLCLVQIENEEEDGEEDVSEVSLGKVLRMNSPEWYLLLGACVCSTLVGTAMPVAGLVLAEFLKVFSIPKEEQTDKVNLLLGFVMAIAVGNAVLKLIMSICYSITGSRLTARFRTLAFKSIIWQDIPFFDDPKNRVGVLTTRLARDSGLVQGAAGNKLGAVMESLATVTAALIIAFIYSWKLTLVIFAFMPLTVLSGVMHVKMLRGFSKGNKTVTEEAGKLTSEAINNIRTVASLTREQSFIDKYNDLLNVFYANGKKRSVLQGVMYGLSQSMIFFAYAATFTYGGYLVQYENLPFESVFKVFTAIVLGGITIGRQSSYAPDYNKGKLAASRLFQLIEMKATIDTASEEGSVMSEFRGSILLDDVHFHYPTRPEVEVLRGLSMIIQPGETVAIVGTSGCGKSTTVQLLERFYDPEGGCILADGNDIKSLNLKWFRNQIGIVSQEPCLFDCSIEENIAYGDNSRIVPMDEIISAARKANIHQFIYSLRDGYDTNVGDKGTQLSGGQKQRVAIARALIRNPKVLLLDEATSALDAESEKVVQEALDKARAGRTCIVIAHRLSTIQNSDRIAILHKGCFVIGYVYTELPYQSLTTCPMPPEYLRLNTVFALYFLKSTRPIRRFTSRRPFGLSPCILRS
ncbi:Multidrug resistance protein 1B [Mizuhopecten yessoensis]|uniref:Multidrug resistance protein 1B n=1 Tax=Mizuhopecten yessoensis TaxID=6573 RepID=A0A210PZM0_MIZYE|nr:Multidrug resistance protein 1B [Mizuhopecten yessoensis]